MNAKMIFGSLMMLAMQALAADNMITIVVGAGNSAYNHVIEMSQRGRYTAYGRFAPIGAPALSFSTPVKIAGDGKACLLVSGVTADITYFSPTQINFIAPADLPTRVRHQIQAALGCDRSVSLRDEGRIIEVPSAIASPEFLAQTPIPEPLGLRNLPYVFEGSVLTGTVENPTRKGAIADFLLVGLGSDEVASAEIEINSLQKPLTSPVRITVSIVKQADAVQKITVPLPTLDGTQYVIRAFVRRGNNEYSSPWAYFNVR